MGEYVNDLDLVGENVQQKLVIASELVLNGLDIHVLADPTQIVRYQQLLRFLIL